MNWRRQFAKLGHCVRRRKLADEIDEEVRIHIEMEEEENLERGMSAEEAHYAALRRFGNVTQAQETSREAWGWPWLETLLQDLRYGLRQLRRNPGFTAVAVLTLALGIGANTAIFTLIDSLMLRPLPVRRPGQLVQLWLSNPHSQIQQGLFSVPMFEELRQRQEVFSSLAAYGGPILPVEVNDEPVLGIIEMVTPGYFSTLGTSPLFGRFFGLGGVGTDSHVVPTVISYQFWQAHFGGNRDVLGKTIEVNGHPWTIVGVARKDFFGVSIGISVDIWVPMPHASWTDRKSQSNWLTAKLKNGVSLQQARAQLGAIWPSVLQATAPEKQTPKQRSEFLAQRLRVEPAGTGILPSFLVQFRQPLWILMGAVGFVLLIACVNLAHLMLARAAGRHQELEIRLALGATRRRLLRQMLTESLMLSISGALLGFPFAYWTSGFLAHFIWVAFVPLGANLSPDIRVFCFAAVAALATGILFGLAPAWQAARQDPSILLQHGPRTVGTSRSRQRFSSGLVIAQIALSLALVDGAALFIHSLGRLDSVNLGFRTHDLTLIDLQAKSESPKSANTASYWHELIRDVSALPDVRAVSISDMEPLFSSLDWKEPVSAGSADAAHAGPILANLWQVSPGFFKTFGITLLQGRDFNLDDDPKSPRVAIISRTVAKGLFPRGGAKGQVVNVGDNPEEQNLRVVGIVADARLGDPRNPRSAEVYVPFFQQYGSDYLDGDLQVWTRGNSAPVANAVLKRVKTLGRQYPFWVHLMQQQVEKSIVRERMLAMLSWFFGALALLLAAIGLYGLVSYAARSRTREIAIRMALGAERAQVMRLMLQRCLMLVLAGICIGVPVALVASRLASGLLFQVSPNDAGILVVVSGVLLAVALLSAYIPARRAAKVDPMVALRYE